MKWWEKLIGSGTAEAAGALGGLATDLREAIKGKEIDPNKRIELSHKLIQMQGEINKIEAASGSLFIGGWRPFIGWVAGVALGMFYIPQFAMGAYIWTKMCLEAGELYAYPVDITGLNQLVFALLGMAGIRTYEKISKVAKQ